MALRVGVISDTHGLLRPEVKGILRSCGALLHAGDIGSPELVQELQMLAPMGLVRGNNDRGWGTSLPLLLNSELEGVPIVMTHIKKDVPAALGRAKIVITGHTHRYSAIEKDGRLWLNPGSCGPRRFGQEITMAVLKLENGSYTLERIDIPQA